MQSQIQKSMVEIFSTMVMMDVSPTESDIQLNESLQDCISAVIGFSGVRKGLIAIHMPTKVALSITSSFLMMDVSEVNEDVKDAIGELANMIGGQVKNVLTEGGKDINLSIPTTINGSSYEFSCNAETDRILTSFEVESGIFTVDYQLEK